MGARLAALTVGPPHQRPLAVAHAVSAAADGCVTVSFAGSLFFSLSPEASRQQVLLYLLITMAPLAVLSPLVGPAVDRFRRRPQLVAAICFVLRAGASLGLAASLYRLSFYLFAVVLLVINKASGVIKQALVPLVTDETEQLVATNARLARLSSVGGAIGAAIGAGVYRYLGAPQVLWLAAVLFIGSAVAVSRLDPLRRPEPVSEVIEYAETHMPTVVVGSIGFVAIRLAVGFFVLTMAFTLRRTSEPTWVYVAAITAYGAGSFAGNVITPALRRFFKEQTLLSLAISAPAVLALVGIFGVTRPLLLAVATLVGLSTTLGRHAFDALLQARAPASLRGRSGAKYETRFSLAYVLGALAATPINLSVEASMAVLSAIYIPTLVVFVRAFARARRIEQVSGGTALQGAMRSLADAEERALTGELRMAVIGAFAAADFAQLADPTVGPAERAEIDLLRRAALDAAAPLTADEVLDAIEAVRNLISRPASAAPQ